MIFINEKRSLVSLPHIEQADSDLWFIMKDFDFMCYSVSESIAMSFAFFVTDQ